MRDATLVLIDADARVVGQLQNLQIATPWLQEVAAVCDAAAAQLGVGVTVLRLLHATAPGSAPRRVTYLAEMDAGAAATDVLAAWSGGLPDHPQRFEWARPGGPTAVLDWVRAELVAGGHRVRSVRQLRTWNLSAIWRLETCGGETLWLKCVPPFLAHEGPVIKLLAGSAPVPELVAAAPERILVRDIPGEDLWQAPLVQLQAMIDVLVDLQWHWHQRLDLLRAAGVPVADVAAIADRVTDTITRNRDGLRPAARRRLSGWAARLPQLCDDIAACGVPNSLVHGDFHPGNWRGTGAHPPATNTHMRLLDWGDCVIGHPLLDLTDLLDRVAADLRPALLAHWQKAWQAHVPGADVKRACDLLWPLATAHMASTYQMFLDNIEPSERIYHASDPVDCLHLTAARIAAQA